MELSQHAARRGQQRAIPPMIVDLLLRFGAAEPAGGNTEKLFFDKRARRHVATYTGGCIRAIDESLNAYIIVSGQMVVTTGYRLKKINRQ